MTIISISHTQLTKIYGPAFSGLYSLGAIHTILKIFNHLQWWIIKKINIRNGRYTHKRKLN